MRGTLFRAGSIADEAAALTTRDNAIVQKIDSRPVVLRGVSWRGFTNGTALDGLTAVQAGPHVCPCR